uniref:ANK_REP_REGION domain-containing protein n=1 Tax=Anopheles gambiae TaxID=7165 RepID=A0A453YZ66_ANOGA
MFGKRPLDNTLQAPTDGSAPGPSKKTKADPKRRTLQCFTHGIAYQVKLLVLFTQTLNKQMQQDKSIFCNLKSEDPEGGKFDDLLFEYEYGDQKRSFFFQAKHKADPNQYQITLNDLITTRQNDAPFAIAPLFQSFYDKLQHGSDDVEPVLMLCTNADLSPEVQELTKPYTFAFKWLEETFGSIVDSNTSFSQIDLDKFKQLNKYTQFYRSLSECSECMRLAGALADAIYNRKPVTLKDPLFSKYCKAIVENIVDVTRSIKKDSYKIRTQFFNPNDLFLEQFKQQYEQLDSKVDALKDAEDKGICCSKGFIDRGSDRFDYSSNSYLPVDTVSNALVEKYFQSFVLITGTLNEVQLTEECKKQFESVSMVEGGCAHGMVFEELFNYVKDPDPEPLENEQIERIWKTTFYQLQFLQLKGFTVSRQQELEKLGLRLQESKVKATPLYQELLARMSSNSSPSVKEHAYDMLVVHEIIKVGLKEIRKPFEFLFIQESTFEQWQDTVESVLCWLTAPLVLIVEVQNESKKHELVKVLKKVKPKQTHSRMIIILSPATVISQGNINVSCLSDQSYAVLDQRQLTLHGTIVSVRDLIRDTDKLSFLMYLLSLKELPLSLNQKRFSTLKNKYVTRELIQDDNPNEIDLNEVESKTIVILDAPGNGKSSYITWLAQHLETKNSEQWILRFNAIEYSYDLNEIAKECETNAMTVLRAVQILFQFAYMTAQLGNIHQSSDVTTTSQRQTAKSCAEALRIENGTFVLDETKVIAFSHEQLTLLRMFVSKLNGRNMIIFFDGFDEVSPNYETVALSLLSMLDRLDGISRMWIASRPYELKAKFKQALRDVCFLQVGKFSEKVQLTYLKNRLRRITPYTDENKVTRSKLMELSFKFLTTIEDYIRELRQQFLFFEMMFEVLIKDYFCPATLTLLMDVSHGYMKGMELTQLIERFIKLKLEIVDTSKMGLASAGAATVEAQNRAAKRAHEALQGHMALGYYVFAHFYLSKRVIDLQDSEFDADALTKAKEYMQELQTANEKTGLVERIVDDRPIFVHRIIEEYFAMRHLFEGRAKESNTRHVRLFYAELRKFNFNWSYGDMMDRFSIMDGNNVLPLHLTVLETDGRAIKRILDTDPDAIEKRDAFGRTALHLAMFRLAIHQHRPILEQMIALAAERHCIQVQDTLFGWQAIDYALMVESLEMVRGLSLKQGYLKDTVDSRLVLALKILNTLALHCNDGELEQHILCPLLSNNYLRPYCLHEWHDKAPETAEYAGATYCLLDAWRFLPEPSWVVQFKGQSDNSNSSLKRLVANFSGTFMSRNRLFFVCREHMGLMARLKKMSEMPPKYIDIRVYVDEPSLIGDLRGLDSTVVNGALTRLKNSALTNRVVHVLLVLFYGSEDDDTLA